MKGICAVERHTGGKEKENKKGDNFREKGPLRWDGGVGVGEGLALDRRWTLLALVQNGCGGKKIEQSEAEGVPF